MWIVRPIYLRDCVGLRQFVLRILAQQFAVKLLLAIAVAIVISDSHETPHPAVLRDPLSAFVLIVLIAPIVETLLLQAAPIETCRGLRRSKWVQFLSGWLPFAALHFPLGVAAGVAGFVGGAFFTHTYLECRSRSWWSSVGTTVTTHSLHNLVVFPLLLIMSG